MTPTAPREAKGLLAACLVSASLVAAGCDEKTPTAIDDAQLPAEPLTLEIQLPWDDFASNLEVVGGYSGPQQLGAGIIAQSFQGTLDARTLIRFGGYPQSASVVDPTGTTRTDFDLTFIAGRVVAFFDTLVSTNTGPVTLALGALQDDWHAASTTWSSAVDTLGEQRPWPEAGAGPVAVIDTRVWDPATADSVSFFLDSTQVAAWGDVSDPTRGARLELLTAGERLQLRNADLRLTTRSSINPDTIFEVTAPATQATFVYNPTPAPPTDGFRVGGAPAWRSVLDVSVPAALTGPPELCASVGCPFTLAPEHISFAGLGLITRAGDAAFEPLDSVRLDVRAVLNRAAMPKSPLGSSLIQDPSGAVVGPGAFGAQEGQLFEVPITSFVRGVLAGPDPAGRPPPTSLALLSFGEPSSFGLASFYGPGGPLAPVLNLIVTVSRPLELP